VSGFEQFHFVGQVGLAEFLYNIRCQSFLAFKRDVAALYVAHYFEQA
jgi:hypothetical protein